METRTAASHTNITDGYTQPHCYAFILCAETKQNKIYKGKSKGNVHAKTGHKGPEGE
jgi:hypothetical protein